MSAFFARITRRVISLVKRFLRNDPDNPYEDLAFRLIREAATIYSRRVIVL